MKFFNTAIMALALTTPAYAAPTAPTAADVVAANQAANAAVATVAKFHRAGGISYRNDPIAAAKPIRSANSAKSKPVTTVVATKPVRVAKPMTLAAAFTPAYMASLKKR